MNRSRIGGVLDMHALAVLHRPRSAEAMRQAITDMAARGLGPYEIAQACEVTVDQVRRIVADHRRGQGCLA